MVGSLCPLVVLQDNRQSKAGVPGAPYAQGGRRANLAACLEEFALKRVAAIGLVCFVASVAHAQAPAAPAPVPAPVPAAVDGSCVLMVKVGEQYLANPLTGFNPANTATPLPVPEASANATLVMCSRATIVPEVTDYRVPVEMHLPLAIKAGDKSLFLGINKGKLQVGVPEGQSGPDEVKGLSARIDEMQLAMAKAAGVNPAK
jgi:hypothetical protein